MKKKNRIAQFVYRKTEIKKLAIFIFCTNMLLLGCIPFTKTTKVQEIDNKFLEDLSKDLAEIHIMVENVSEEYKKEEMLVKVIEPWTESPGLKFVMQTPSGREEFDVIEKSKLRVPTIRGWAITDVFKVMRGKDTFIGVAEAGAFGKFMLSIAKESPADGYKIKFYDPQLGTDPKSVAAITQYVSLTYKLEETTKKILDPRGTISSFNLEPNPFHLAFYMVFNILHLK